jgi:hypothetical protein
MVALILGSAALACAVFVSAPADAHAYAVGGGTSAGTGTGATDTNNVSQSLNSLSTPFENFVQSLDNMWNNPGGAGSSAAGSTLYTPPSWTTQILTTGAQGAAESFDNWLYGIFGFHISTFFVAILNIFSWILGVMQGAVNWLLGVFK